MAHKVKCPKCSYAWSRRSTMYIARCPRCGGFQMLKKLPDRRFRKARRRRSVADKVTPTSGLTVVA